MVGRMEKYPYIQGETQECVVHIEQCQAISSNILHVSCTTL